jgi:hypothetical protein
MYLMVFNPLVLPSISSKSESSPREIYRLSCRKIALKIEIKWRNRKKEHIVETAAATSVRTWEL